MAQFLSAFGTVFVGVGFLCAPIAAVATFVVYVFLGTHHPALSIGAGLAVLAASAAGMWLAFERRFQSAADVYRDQYKHLVRRLESARHRLETCPVEVTRGLVAAAQKDASAILADLTTQLGERRRGTHWISAAAYLEAWSDLNRLEEAMLFLLPRQQVLAMARDDQSRLTGSKIEGAGNLRDRLGRSIQQLAGGESPAAPSPDVELAARADIVLVRNSINRSREDKWGQLVGSRNNMMLAAAIAGVIAYLALISVVVWHIDSKALQVAATFVITGCLVSLLHQVTLVGTAEGGVADFGQSTARLLSATFVSGLIALLGVVVLDGSSLTINGAPLLASFGSWAQTFDWTQNRSGFFWAAAFGLAPSALFQMLQVRTDAIKSSLSSSRAAGGA